MKADAAQNGLPISSSSGKRVGLVGMLITASLFVRCHAPLNTSLGVNEAPQVR